MAEKSFDFQIIANLISGNGHTKKILSDLKDFLEAHQQTYCLLSIEEPTHIYSIPWDGETEIKKGVICLGGDGTVSETVGFMASHHIDTPIALLPSGTANVIAESLDLDKISGFDFLLNNKTTLVDVGLAEYKKRSDFFIIGLGLGFDEKFLKGAKNKHKARFGRLSYLFGALSELMALRRIPLTIEIDGKETNVNVCSLLVLNLEPKIPKLLPFFRGGMTKSDDKILNLFYIEYKNYFQAFWGTLLFHVFGNRNFGAVTTLSGRSFFIDSSDLVETQIDGEIKEVLPVKVSLASKPLRFLTA